MKRFTNIYLVKNKSVNCSTTADSTVQAVQNPSVHFILVCQTKSGSTYFLWLLISSWDLCDMCQRFLCSQKWNFSWIRHKMQTLPIDSLLKNRQLLTTSCIDMTLPKVADFYNRCLWGISLSIVGINWKFVSDYIYTLTHIM